MTADEFRTALRVLEEGRAAHNIYEFEDAAAMVAPVKRAYWRVIVAATLIAIVPVSLALALLRAPGTSVMIVFLLPTCLFYLRSFRDRFMPVTGLGHDEIIRASLK